MCSNISLFLNFISLMMNDVQQFFMSLFAIYISFLVNCSNLLPNCFSFMKQGCKSFWYILAESFIMYMFYKYFLQPVACLVIFLIVSFKEQKFIILRKSSLSSFIFQSLCSLHSKKSWPNPVQIFFFFLHIVFIVATCLLNLVFWVSSDKDPEVQMLGPSCLSF